MKANFNAVLIGIGAALILLAITHQKVARDLILGFVNMVW